MLVLQTTVVFDSADNHELGATQTTEDINLNCLKFKYVYQPPTGNRVQHDLGPTRLSGSEQEKYLIGTESVERSLRFGL